MLDHAALLTDGAHHIARGVLQKDQRGVGLATKLDKLCRFGRSVGVDWAIVADKGTSMTMNAILNADGLAAVTALELEQVRIID